MLPYNVILFDVGGVLLTNGWDHAERQAAIEAFHLDGPGFESRHAEIDDRWECGAITMDEYLSFTVFDRPRSFSPEDFRAFVFAQSSILPDGALDMLRRLAWSGRYLLGALNNEARETNDYRFNLAGLRSYFDLALSSCYLGLRKPEEAIYRRALDILGASPERILFIDDREENLVPARALGMTAIHFTGADELQRSLESLGVI